MRVFSLSQLCLWSLVAWVAVPSNAWAADEPAGKLLVGDQAIELADTRCRFEQNTLKIMAATDTGRGAELSVELPNFSVLPATVTWSGHLPPAEGSIVYTDAKGIRWEPRKLEKKGKCQLSLQRAENILKIRVNCQDMVNKDTEVPGELTFTTDDKAPLSCELKLP